MNFKTLFLIRKFKIYFFSLRNLSNLNGLGGYVAIIKLQKESILISDTQKERQDSLRTSINELDVRLQREFIIANNNIKSTAEALNKSSSEEKNVLTKQIDKLELYIIDNIKGDLMELRERRLKDHK